MAGMKVRFHSYKKFIWITGSFFPLSTLYNTKTLSITATRQVLPVKNRTHKENRTTLIINSQRIAIDERHNDRMSAVVNWLGNRKAAVIQGLKGNKTLLNILCGALGSCFIYISVDKFLNK